MHSLNKLHTQLTITEYHWFNPRFLKTDLTLHFFTKHHPEPLERQQSTSSATLKVSSGRDLRSAVSRDLPSNNTTSLSPWHQPCPQTYRKCTHTTYITYILVNLFKRCVCERRWRRNGSYRGRLSKTTFAFPSHVLLNITFNYFVFKQDFMTGCFFFFCFFFLTANFL